MSSLHWIYKLENYEQIIADSIKEREELATLLNLLNEYQGVDAFIKFNEEFMKTGIKPVEKIFNRLKKVYVKQHYKTKSVRQLANELDVEQRTIYVWMKNLPKKKEDEIDFD